MKSVLFSVMLGILILQKYIQKELQKNIKTLLMILIMMKLNFLWKKKILAKLKQNPIFALTCLITKID